MESALQKAMNEFDLEAMDASLQDAGAALSNAESTRAAGKAMKEGNYAKTGEELRKMDASELSKQERKAVSDQLKQAGEGMERRNMSDLAKLTEKMAKELEKSDCEGCKDSACQLAGACEKQGLRKGICQSLANKLSLLGMCKSECSGSCNSEKNGGDGTKKSNSPSSSWGTGAAGDPRTGEETELGGNRQMQKLDGIQGAGPSEVETIKTAEGDDAAPGRAYKDVYSEYRKISETVLETEPIPLGQRQIIRKYFESIRPHEGEK